VKLVLTFPPHSLYMYVAPLVSGLQTPAYIAGEFRLQRWGKI